MSSYETLIDAAKRDDNNAIALSILEGWLLEPEKLQIIINHYDGLNPDNILSQLLKEGIEAIESRKNKQTNSSKPMLPLDTVDKADVFIAEVEKMIEELRSEEEKIRNFPVNTPEFETDIEANGLRQAILSLIDRAYERKKELQKVELGLQFLRRALDWAGEIREKLESKKYDKIPPEIKAYIDHRLEKANNNEPPFLDDDIPF